jgi:DNA mismatch repair protein MutL
MGRIRILSDVVANKIAAGEVVERPASVIKEMLENSLDAGATELRIEAEAGGRRLLRIADNGHGMLRDDALLAFERHATSKLADVRDLDRIATLGFRGEALPSIASVSRLTLETRAREEDTGSRVEIAGGKILKFDEAALPPGTTITVRDLFYNVPARKKFLRSEQTELAHIGTLVTHYSLAHPEKSFELRHNGAELLYVTPAADMRERVYQVFGSQVLDDLIELGDRAREMRLPALPGEADEDRPSREFRLRGFVSGPQVQKLNRNSIYLFVNGRLIRDKVLMHALTAAYHNLMPPGCYPFALLFLDCDAEEVDVNVHPAKTEVRFRHSGIVHDFVRDTIRDALMEHRPVPSAPTPVAAQPAATLPFSEFSQRAMDYAQQMPSFEEQPVSSLPSFQLRTQFGPAPRFDFGDALTTSTPTTFPTAAPVETGSYRPPVPETHGPLPAGADWTDPATSLDALRDLRPLGQIHDSFIIAAGRDGLWIIDQHVAHERILFEQVLRKQATGTVERQQLLMPHVFELSAGQQIEYARIAEDLAAAGFETEPFGKRTIAVKAAPAELSAAEIERVLLEILEIAEAEFRKISVADLRRGIAASIACRAAIKVNMPLDQRKMEWLLQSLAACEYPMSCPHGRPIALRYSTREILRSFHRI